MAHMRREFAAPDVKGSALPGGFRVFHRSAAVSGPIGFEREWYKAENYGQIFLIRNPDVLAEMFADVLLK